MVFPDYYFFAERRLVNHNVEEKRVKNLDNCELLCYLNDACVSLNYKKDPENDKRGHICELNNVTHLKYDRELTTDANFYYRGSKVSLHLGFVFLEWYISNNLKSIQIFEHYLMFHSFNPSIFLSVLKFPQSACDKNSPCQNKATCQSGFTLKGYRCLCAPGFNGERCENGMYKLMFGLICEISSDFQCAYDHSRLVG